MNMKLIVILFSLNITIIFAARCRKNCCANQQYLECGTCNKTCEDVPDNMGCPKMCFSPGCYCKPGFVRANKNSLACIEESICPKNNCSENEIYTWNTICPTYCKDVEDKTCIKPFGPKGCHCKPGYIRLSPTNPECIQKSKCLINQSSCGENEVYSECGSACPNYCGKPDNIACVAVCVPGCFCKPGFIRKSEDSTECIPETSCPKNECGDNEVYTDCGTACPDYCGKPNDRACIAMCVPGCFCKPGFIRKSEDSTECIPEISCPKNQCNNNEVYTDCGTACPNYCGKPNDTACILMCVPGCTCKPGFIRESVNSTKCIEENTCTKDQCGENEIHSTCGTACERYCGGPIDIICTMQCVNGCFCKDGYIRESKDSKKCIPDNYCEI